MSAAAFVLKQQQSSNVNHPPVPTAEVCHGQDKPQTVQREIWFFYQWTCQSQILLHITTVSLLQKYQKFPLGQEVIFWSVSELKLPCCQGHGGTVPTSSRYPDDLISEIWLHSGTIFSSSGEGDPALCEMFVQWGGREQDSQRQRGCGEWEGERKKKRESRREGGMVHSALSCSKKDRKSLRPGGGSALPKCLAVWVMWP